MITKEQYDHAGNMLSLLDMNTHEEQYQKYLEIALDFEIANGYYCGNRHLNNSLISKYQTQRPLRSAGSIILISEPLIYERLHPAC
jgi:hypothetical protein